MKTKSIFFLSTICGGIIFTLFILFGFKSAPEKQTIYGPPVKTHGLHNTDCVSCNGSDFETRCWDNFCFGEVILTAECPKGWHFTGDWNYHAINDPDHSLAWNNGHYPKNTQILEKTPRYMKVRAFFGSHEMEVNLEVYAEKD